jgi:hypothetical protein
MAKHSCYVKGCARHRQQLRAFIGRETAIAKHPKLHRCLPCGRWICDLHSIAMSCRTFSAAQWVYYAPPICGKCVKLYG